MTDNTTGYGAHRSPTASALRKFLISASTAALLIGTAAVAASPAMAAGSPESFAPLVDKVKDAVVNISSSGSNVGEEDDADDQDGPAQQMPALPPGSPLEQLFKGMRPQQAMPHKATSLGSGFIVDPSGFVVTNNHVVKNGTDIKVTLADGTVLPAKLVGHDERTDLAVLKVEAGKPLPAVAFGSSAKEKVGDWVLAVGNPFGLGGSVTAGIVSASGRDIHAGPYDDFLQIDAAINRGNSGGPTFNMNGEVIGVNTAIFTQSAGYQGIGFAMPSNTVADIYNDLISPSHKVVRGSIGIQFRQGLSGAVNRVYGFKNGVLVQQVQPNGPADKAGLKPGDIITTLDGRQIKDGDDLVNEIASRRPGSSIRLGYLRDGKTADATVTIGDRDKVFADLGQQQSQSQPDMHAEPGDKLGIQVRDASPQTAAKLHVPGVVIQSVRSGSFADLQGLEPGLVITRINKQPTGTKDQFDAVVSKLKTGDDVVFEILDPRRPNDGINYIGGTLQ